MSEAPQQNKPADPHDNPWQPYLVLGVTTAAFVALTGLAVVTRHPVAFRAAFQTGAKILTGTMLTGVAATAAVTLGGFFDDIFDRPATGPRTKPPTYQT